MMRRDATASEDDSVQALRAEGVALGRQQQHRLRWLSQTFGPLVPWSDRLSPRQGRTIVVIDPPTGAGAELLYGSLTAHDAVVIPFGENPAFDFLKSKLTAFGTVGASADGPHEMWWGGTAWRLPDAAPARDGLRVVSCHASNVGDLHIYHLRRSVERLGLPLDLESIETRQRGVVSAAEKAGFIQRMWQRHAAPLLFVDADVMLQSVPNLPLLAGCDFGVHTWNGWEMSARTLYFGQSEAAGMLLAVWREMASSHPDVWDGYLIDQAWSLVSSQVPLDTVWLPRSYHAVAGEHGARTAAIVHNLRPTAADLGPDPEFAALARSARRAGRAGARDPLLILQSDVTKQNAVTVILREVEGSSARDTAASIEALTSAFIHDHGGFSRLELSLCPWQQDVRLAREAAFLADNKVIEVAPGQELPPNLFRAFAVAEAARQPLKIDAYGR
ncbi:hypothetical protein SSBR45G_42890 [Bradyrhizobium sp. SSBR45G]|uniref:hypothetical protein n=1 Tax=unclassified Bradyrhizobium TaxID=2631580 RepID=UPI002342A060|nr:MULTISPECIES: hypothetical protein [unclassified Bradyrhizobium]GLH79380.1 hypothetical protein SSBR45G_42890 [Bradyrhizobium sp. SSBR45G]GLH86684.1 hypothetical protein SSBR45R_41440 [Bradyrhizobium sp. SSBR45R]